MMGVTAQQAMLNSEAFDLFNITVGDSGSGIFGYGGSFYGSISPSPANLSGLPGTSIIAIQYVVATPRIQLQIFGTSDVALVLATIQELEINGTPLLLSARTGDSTAGNSVVIQWAGVGNPIGVTVGVVHPIKITYT